MTPADPVVVTGTSHARVDSWGRPGAAAARVLLGLVAGGLRGCVDGAACAPHRLPDERWRCPRCHRWWTASHAGTRFAVAVCATAVGVDIENGRHRPRALRAASAWCTFPLQDMAQWTQAEALWKAAGKGRRTPRDGEIPTPQVLRSGWQLSADGGYWLYSRPDRDAPWSVAVPRAGEQPPSLAVLGWDELAKAPVH